MSALQELVDVGSLHPSYERIEEARAELADLRARVEEREADMHMRIRLEYDKAVADSWKAENAKVCAERDLYLAELQDLRARALPVAIVDAVSVYQEAFLRWSSDCMNVDNVFILEKVKEELMRRIEADAKGEEK